MPSSRELLPRILRINSTKHTIQRASIKSKYFTSADPRDVGTRELIKSVSILEISWNIVVSYLVPVFPSLDVQLGGNLI